MGNKTCIGNRDKEFPCPLGGKLYNLKGIAKRSGRRGEIVGFDPQDRLHTLKLEFFDGQTPQADWFAEEDVEVRSNPFAISVVVQGSKKPLQIKSLMPNESLASLRGNVAKLLEVSPERTEIMPDKLTYAFAYTDADEGRGLGILGLGEGAVITCAVHDYDSKRLRLETATEKVAGESGELESWAVTILTYRLEASGHELLLWAEHCISPPAAESGPKPELTEHELRSSHGQFLSVGSLLSAARAQNSGAPLEDQLKARFSDDENWARILARICRKLAS